MNKLQVIIIGAGPAGLATGIVCARNAVKTCLIEKKILPADKACGEGLMPPGWPHLENLGAARFLNRRDYYPFSGIRYHASNGSSATGIFREGPGYGIPRPALSRALLQRARELQDSLRIVDGLAVRAIERTSEAITVILAGRRLSAPLLVGADGLHSLVRRWAGLKRIASRRQRWGIRQHFAIPPWSDYVEVYWGRGLEAYVTPCGEDLIDVAFLWQKCSIPGTRAGGASFSALLEAFPPLQARLERAHPCGDVLAAGSFEQKVPRVVADGVLLVGDAAGYLDAITGEGISLALSQALSLERTVIPPLKTSKTLLRGHDLAAYARAHRRRVRSNYWMTRLALLLSSRPRTAEKAVELLSRHPRIFQSLLSLNMGNPVFSSGSRPCDSTSLASPTPFF